MADREQLRRQTLAQAILKNELLEEIFEDLEKDYFESFKKDSSLTKLEHIHAELSALGRLRDLVYGKCNRLARGAGE